MLGAGRPAPSDYSDVAHVLSLMRRREPGTSMYGGVCKIGREVLTSNVIRSGPGDILFGVLSQAVRNSRYRSAPVLAGQISLLGEGSLVPT